MEFSLVTASVGNGELAEIRSCEHVSAAGILTLVRRSDLHGKLKSLSTCFSRRCASGRSPKLIDTQRLEN